MARLKRLQPSVGMLERRLDYLPPDHDGMRRARYAWRKWYGTARWRRLRMDCLRRDLFTCQMCGVVEADTSQLVADHKDRHGGDPTKFWNLGNLQCLCKRCHDSTKQRQEARERRS